MTDERGMTPPIKEFINEELKGYDNALRHLSKPKCLFGTEDLYGDWNGRCLLLAKDFASSEILKKQLSTDRRYMHDPQALTNKRLVRHAHALRTGSTPETCGMLYGSALGPMCRTDGAKSGRLPNYSEAIAFGTRIVESTHKNMKGLRVVVCLGEVAWACASRYFDIPCTWQDARDSSIPRVREGVAIVAAYHPAARRVSIEQRWAPWRAVYDSLGVPFPDSSARAA